jgi:hypothetical protein
MMKTTWAGIIVYDSGQILLRRNYYNRYSFLEAEVMPGEVPVTVARRVATDLGGYVLKESEIKPLGKMEHFKPRGERSIKTSTAMYCGNTILAVETPLPGEFPVWVPLDSATDILREAEDRVFLNDYKDSIARSPGIHPTLQAPPLTARTNI